MKTCRKKTVIAVSVTKDRTNQTTHVLTAQKGRPSLRALPEAILIVLYVCAIEICQDIDKTSSVLVVGDSPAIIAFAGKISKCSIRHGIFWSKIVEENSELVHGNP